jgi:DNA repair exonuclease SbcCD nuclease subunit
MSKPIAVLISDIHYSLQTLELADKSLRMAIDKANELGVQLIIAGDLHDTKANLRGECVNAMIKTFKTAKNRPWVLVGNHDKINEKSIYHSLNFLSPYAEVINDTTHCIATDTPVVLIPYQFAASGFSWELARLKERKIIIAHQGIQGSDGGHYIQDLSAIRKEEAGTFRIISGHYHKRQDIELTYSGIWSYIGNPYTLTFGEANDPEKGFQILNEDGSLTFVPTNLRKHIVIDVHLSDSDELVVRNGYYEVSAQDIVQVRLKGSKSQLPRANKFKVGQILGLQDFKLDLIPNDDKLETEGLKNLSQVEILDGLIDKLPERAAKDALKVLWRSLNEAAKGNGN